MDFKHPVNLCPNCGSVVTRKMWMFGPSPEYYCKNCKKYQVVALEVKNEKELIEVQKEIDKNRKLKKSIETEI
jgi:NMD protein affecting ribosome stability and mRNA decay